MLFVKAKWAILQKKGHAISRQNTKKGISKNNPKMMTLFSIKHSIIILYQEYSIKNVCRPIKEITKDKRPPHSYFMLSPWKLIYAINVGTHNQNAEIEVIK